MPQSARNEIQAQGSTNQLTDDGGQGDAFNAPIEPNDENKIAARSAGLLPITPNNETKKSARTFGHFPTVPGNEDKYSPE